MPMGLLLLLLSAGLGSGLYYGGSLSMLISGAGRTVGLNAIQLIIEGNVRISNETIKQNLEIDSVANLANFDTTKAFAKLSKLAWVESVEISVFYPNKMKIKIVEAKAFAVWENANKLYLIKSDGKIIDEISRLDYLSARYGNNLYYTKGKGAQSGLNEIVSRVKKYESLFSKIKSYVRVGERRWDLLLANNIKIMLPQNEIDNEIDKALQFLVEADESHDIYERQIAYIDLRLADRIVMGTNDDYLAEEKPSTQQLSRGLQQ